MIKDKISGVIYGLALGDALGMPSELWGRDKVKNFFGTITTFLPGPPENDIGCFYKKGEFTDDTAQCFVILDSLKENNYVPSSKIIGKNLLIWAENNDAFNKNILGPTSKAVLLLLQENRSADHLTKIALTNGAAMRIAPIGCLFPSNKLQELCNYVFHVSKVTHSSDVAIASASLVAGAVSLAIETNNTRKAVEKVLEIEEYALSLGENTVAPSIKKRILFGIDYITKNNLSEEEFAEFIYHIFGAGVPSHESVTCALLIAWYIQCPNKCGLFCANLGGDTDTIGAIATAICGAAVGLQGIQKEYINELNIYNDIDFNNYIKILEEGRGKLHG